MNNNLSAEALVHKNQDQLFEMLQEAIDYRNDNSGDLDVVYQSIEQIEAVCYVLKNCNYEGSEA